MARFARRQEVRSPADVPIHRATWVLAATMSGWLPLRVRGPVSTARRLTARPITRGRYAPRRFSCDVQQGDSHTRTTPVTQPAGGMGKTTPERPMSKRAAISSGPGPRSGKPKRARASSAMSAGWPTRSRMPSKSASVSPATPARACVMWSSISAMISSRRRAGSAESASLRRARYPAMIWSACGALIVRSRGTGQPRRGIGPIRYGMWPELCGQPASAGSSDGAARLPTHATSLRPRRPCGAG